MYWMSNLCLCFWIISSGLCSNMLEIRREEEKHGLGKRITPTIGLHGGYYEKSKWRFF